MYNRGMDILNEIKALADNEKAQHMQRFFKTGKGEYAEGDLFYGLTTPIVRSIVKKYCKKLSLGEIETLLHNPYHEVRSIGLLLFVEIYNKADSTTKDAIYNIYLRNVEYINNWDLVDISCYKIVGRHSFENNNASDLRKLADSKHLWSERISVVSNYYFIKKRDFSLLLELSEKFLSHRHDLMHKAVGWMLREMGKVDEKPLYDFLDKHYKIMPRTMLRYSLEKLPKDKKLYYMNKDACKGRDCKVK